MATDAQRAANARARAAHLQYAAERALDDPVVLERAARIIRAALARQMLTVDDLLAAPREPERAAS